MVVRLYAGEAAKEYAAGFVAGVATIIVGHPFVTVNDNTIKVDYKEALFLWHVDKKDFLLWTTTCVMTLFLGIEVGVLIGKTSETIKDLQINSGAKNQQLGKVVKQPTIKNLQP